jgi:hypothetical protein
MVGKRRGRMNIQEEVLEEWIEDYQEWVNDHKPICVRCVFHKEIEDEHFCHQLDHIKEVAGEDADETTFTHNLCMFHNIEGQCEEYEPKERI